MDSSVLSVGKSSHKQGQASSGKLEGKDGKKKGEPGETSNRLTTVCMTIFIFRGQPDCYQNRRVLLYFTSPENPDFYETVYAQRVDK